MRLQLVSKHQPLVLTLNLDPQNRFRACSNLPHPNNTKHQTPRLAYKASYLDHCWVGHHCRSQHAHEDGVVAGTTQLLHNHAHGEHGAVLQEWWLCGHVGGGGDKVCCVLVCGEWVVSVGPCRELSWRVHPPQHVSLLFCQLHGIIVQLAEQEANRTGRGMHTLSNQTDSKSPAP